MNALSTVHSQFEKHWDDDFKTITTDNGSEFSTLSDLETLSKTLFYFAHPYTSYEKGAVECHNGLIRRFIPKGKRIDSYSDEQIAQVELWCNGLPRKLLGYRTPDKLFEAELERIYGGDGSFGAFLPSVQDFYKRKIVSYSLILILDIKMVPFYY